MGATESLARFIVETNLDQIPGKAIEIAKEAILTEGLAVILAGAEEDPGKIVTEYVRELGCANQAGVIGKGFRTSVPEAAFANGTLSHAADYDGGFGFGHIGLVTAAVLAPGEAEGVSGKELLEAYITAMEVGQRIGFVLGGPEGASYMRGWHGTSVVGPLVAAAGAAKILKLDVEQTRMALGIAVSEAGGVRQNFGTMTKPFHAGNAAKNGVVAAMLAKRGFTSDANILEAQFGFFNVLGEKGYDLEPVTKGLGETFGLVNGIGVKKYPCCMSTHPALDATLDMVKENDISPEEVEAVECAAHYTAPLILIHNEPKTRLEGKFSMQFCVATAILDRKVGLAQFTDEKVLDPKMQAMIKKIILSVDPEMKATMGCTVTIKLTDGRQYSKRNEIARGYAGSPLSKEELLVKYRDCAEAVLSQQDVERSIQLIETLEEVRNVAELVDSVLAPKASLVR